MSLFKLPNSSDTWNARYLFAVLNLPLLVIGFIFILFGSGVFVPKDLNLEWLSQMDIIHKNETWKELIGKPLQAPRIVFLSSGILFVLLAVSISISAFICTSHTRVNSCLYIWYAILLSAAFLLNMAFIFASAGLFRRAVAFMEHSVKSHYKLSATDHFETVMWDTAQLLMQCCGYHNGNDYRLNRSFYHQLKYSTPPMLIPFSCCKPAVISTNDESILAKCVQEASEELSNFNVGCGERLSSYFVASFIFVTLVALYLIPLVAGASILAVNRRKYYRSNHHRPLDAGETSRKLLKP